MIDRQIELLTPERVQELWPEIEPLVEQVARGNPCAPAALTPFYVYQLATNGVINIFGLFTDGNLALVLISEFVVVDGRKTASILGMAGKDLSQFKLAFWQDVLDWFRANGAKAVDAHTNDRLAKIYLKRYGFTESCSYVRMTL